VYDRVHACCIDHYDADCAVNRVKFFHVAVESFGVNAPTSG
jgi:hypothetical protein